MITEILKEIGSTKNKDDKEIFNCLKTYLKGEKLDSINKDFWSYREENKTVIQQKYPNLFKQMAFFFTLLNDMNGSIKQSYDARKNKDEMKHRMNVCAKLYNKSLQTFADMLGLLENGSVMSAILLWRVIYENYAVSVYILKGTEEEAKLLNEHEIVQKNKLLGIKMSKEEKEKFAKKFGRDFESNEYCWAKNIRGKKSFLKIVRSIKEKKYYKYYLLSAYTGRTNAFSVNNGIVYNEKAVNNKVNGFSPDDAAKSVNIFIVVMSEFANLLINNFIDDKKQKELLEKLVLFYGKEIIRKWKKY